MKRCNVFQKTEERKIYNITISFNKGMMGMWKWVFENINGKHQQKKMELQNDDEYFEFMIEDFNNRLWLAINVSMILGLIFGVLFTYLTMRQENAVMLNIFKRGHQRLMLEGETWVVRYYRRHSGEFKEDTRFFASKKEANKFADFLKRSNKLLENTPYQIKNVTVEKVI